MQITSAAKRSVASPNTVFLSFLLSVFFLIFLIFSRTVYACVCFLLLSFVDRPCVLFLLIVLFFRVLYVVMVRCQWYMQQAVVLRDGSRELYKKLSEVVGHSML